MLFCWGSQNSSLVLNLDIEFRVEMVNASRLSGYRGASALHSLEKVDCSFFSEREALDSEPCSIFEPSCRRPQYTLPHIILVCSRGKNYIFYQTDFRLLSFQIYKLILVCRVVIILTCRDREYGAWAKTVQAWIIFVYKSLLQRIFLSRITTRYFTFSGYSPHLPFVKSSAGLISHPFREDYPKLLLHSKHLVQNKTRQKNISPNSV